MAWLGGSVSAVSGFDRLVHNEVHFEAEYKSEGDSPLSPRSRDREHWFYNGAVAAKKLLTKALFLLERCLGLVTHQSP